MEVYVFLTKDRPSDLLGSWIKRAARLFNLTSICQPNY